jgi:hypothetical protein
MKSMKSIAVTVVAIAALWTAGPASAAGRGGRAAAAARGVGSANHFAGTGNGVWMRQHNRRFATSFGFPSGYGGYGYGNTVYQNPDEADWAEQWQSLYEDNHGAYAKSTLENPQGGARMWEFPQVQGGATVTDEH